ncbi:MAG TPA: SRPBCC family protein [Acidimicrobiales bacterium]|jgi:uncharacterized protein YndB with AHSA1/START domain
MKGGPPDGPVPSAGTGRWQISATVRTSAPVDVVWPLIGEAERWKEWSWMTRTYLLRPGAPDADGVGALRRFGLGPGGSKEEVVAWEPPHHLGYVVVSGLPVRGYRSDVVLENDGGGTVIRWQGGFDEIVPGTGPMLRMALQRMVGGFARRVGRYAETLEGG